MTKKLKKKIFILFTYIYEERERKSERDEEACNIAIAIKNIY